MPTTDDRQPTTPLYVRIPASEAEKLDRAAFELRARKQDLVSGLVSRYVDPSSPSGLAALSELAAAADAGRRVTVETSEDSWTVGRHAFLPTEAPDVLTVEEVAELLKVEREAIEGLAAAGELPGRRVGDEWRFARSAVLEWLAAGEAEETREAEGG
jgi:excisionase family DNA binding protein